MPPARGRNPQGWVTSFTAQMRVGPFFYGVACSQKNIEYTSLVNRY